MMQEGIAKPQTAKPVIGGVLILLAGIGDIIAGIWFATVGTIFAGTLEGIPFWPASTMLQTCGIIWIILGLIAIIGGIFAIKREKFGLAIIGGVLTIYTLLGLIGLILVAISKDEFT